METMQIVSTSLVNDVVRCCPATVSVFNYFGVDSCCGGGATIAQAAENEFVDTDSLVDALRGASRHEAAHTGKIQPVGSRRSSDAANRVSDSCALHPLQSFAAPGQPGFTGRKY